MIINMADGRVVGSSSPSYTLADLKQLAEQWAIERKLLASDRWLVSCWLAWLEKKEKESQRD